MLFADQNPCALFKQTESEIVSKLKNMISEYCPWALACLCVFNAFSAESETGLVQKQCKSLFKNSQPEEANPNLTLLGTIRAFLTV